MVDNTRSGALQWGGTSYNAADEPLQVSLTGGLETFAYDPQLLSHEAMEFQCCQQYPDRQSHLECQRHAAADGDHRQLQLR